jgi:hypothetical protein
VHRLPSADRGYVTKRNVAKQGGLGDVFPCERFGGGHCVDGTARSPARRRAFGSMLCVQDNGRLRARSPTDADTTARLARSMSGRQLLIQRASLGYLFESRRRQTVEFTIELVTTCCARRSLGCPQCSVPPTPPCPMSSAAASRDEIDMAQDVSIGLACRPRRGCAVISLGPITWGAPNGVISIRASTAQEGQRA